MKQTIEYEYFDNSSHFLIACVQLKKDFFFPILVRLSFLISTYVERKAGSYTTTGLSFFCQDQFKKYTKSLVNTNLVNTNFTNTYFQKVPIPHLTRTMKQIFLH